MRDDPLNLSTKHRHCHQTAKRPLRSARYNPSVPNSGACNYCPLSHAHQRNLRNDTRQCLLSAQISPFGPLNNHEQCCPILSCLQSAGRALMWIKSQCVDRRFVVGRRGSWSAVLPIAAQVGTLDPRPLGRRCGGVGQDDVGERLEMPMMIRKASGCVDLLMLHARTLWCLSKSRGGIRCLRPSA